jgi:hypothetical protein
MDTINQAPKRSGIDDLAKKFMPAPRMVPCSGRIPGWLAAVLDQRITELRSKGSRITKEAIIAAALQQYLEVDSPE